VNIRSASELVEFLDDRKKWRKRELISLVGDLKRAKPDEVRWIGRAALLLAYAHLEGFVKDAASAYVHLVACKSRRLSDLAACFQALACRAELSVAQSASRRIGPHLEVVTRLTDRLHEACHIEIARAIDTESNLTAPVLQNICDSVGTNYAADWSTDGPFIDDLFRNRSAVAHGELFVPDKAYAVEALEFTIKAIDKFSTAIENAAIQKAYLRTASATIPPAGSGGAGQQSPSHQ
jgi:hypothetical protein